MRIAQVAPLSEAVPPKLYGGTERVIHWLTEELVALGHDVTLFASGDSLTSAKLDASWPRALRLDGSVRDANALHMLMLERVRQRRGDFRFPAFPSGLLSLLAVLPPIDAVRHHAAWPARPAGAPTGLYDLLVGAGDLDLQCATAAAPAGALGADHPPWPAREAAHAAGRHAAVFRVPGTHRSGERRRPRDPDRATLRHNAQDRRQGRQCRTVTTTRRRFVRSSRPPIPNISARSARARNPRFSAGPLRC